MKHVKQKSQKMSIQNGDFPPYTDINDFVLQHQMLLLRLERFQYDNTFFYSLSSVKKVGFRLFLQRHVRLEFFFQRHCLLFFIIISLRDVLIYRKM